MRAIMPEKLENGRIRRGEFASSPSDGAYGFFFVQGPCGAQLKIIASGADADDLQSQGWEHVSVSCADRCPNWQEMCFVKDLFWEPEECVAQFHPPESQYVNNHRFVLHLWRNKSVAFPMPPSILVGIKAIGEIQSPEEARLVRQVFGAMP